jgi:hypothetical protein
MANRWPTVGKHVVFCDEHGTDHDALVTDNFASPETWPYPHGPTVNCLFVSDDPARKDQYGRQIERPSSVPHSRCPGTAHGRYWRWPDEARNPITASAA